MSSQNLGDSNRHAADGEADIDLPSDTEIRIVRRFRAGRREVFDAWTRPESVAQWWDPSGAPLAVCDIDLKPGGAFRFEHAAARGGGHVFAGVYREIAAPDLLVFATPSPGGGDTVGTLRFEDAESGARLTMTMRSPSREARDLLLKLGVDQGTARTLANLAAYLGRNGRQAP